MKQKANKLKKNHLFSARTGNQSLLVHISIFVLLIFTLCSAMAVISHPSSPASWSMAVFFALLLAIVLGLEENMFPNLAIKKAPTAIATWFLAFMFTAFFVAFISTMHMAYLAVAILFAAIIMVVGTYTISSDEKWGKVKQSLKRNTSEKISKKLPKRKKKKKKRKKKAKINRW